MPAPQATACLSHGGGGGVAVILFRCKCFKHLVCGGALLGGSVQCQEAKETRESALFCIPILQELPPAPPCTPVLPGGKDPKP